MFENPVKHGTLSDSLYSPKRLIGTVDAGERTWSRTPDLLRAGVRLRASPPLCPAAAPAAPAALAVVPQSQGVLGACRVPAPGCGTGLGSRAVRRPSEMRQAPKGSFDGPACHQVLERGVWFGAWGSCLVPGALATPTCCEAVTASGGGAHTPCAHRHPS